MIRTGSYCSGDTIQSQQAGHQCEAGKLANATMRDRVGKGDYDIAIATGARILPTRICL